MYVLLLKLRIITYILQLSNFETNACQQLESMALHFDRNQEATVWIGGLDENVDESLLWELMIQAGLVVSVNIPRDKITHEHQGYAFCEFASEEDADYAMKIMNMVRLYGKSLKINKASRDRKDTGVGANVFVGNLDPEVDDQVCTIYPCTRSFLFHSIYILALFYLHNNH